MTSCVAGDHECTRTVLTYVLAERADGALWGILRAALTQAAEQGEGDVVKLMLDEGASLDLKDLKPACR